MRWSRAFLGLALAALGVGCGEMSSLHHEYKPVDQGFEKNKNKIVLNIGATRTKHDDGLDTEYRHGAPYTLSVIAYATDGSKQPLEVRGVSLEHEGKTVVVRDASDEPLRAELQTASNMSHHSASVRVPLDDKLTWIEGSKLKIAAQVRPPYSAKVARVEHDFEAEVRRESASRFEVIMAH